MTPSYRITLVQLTSDVSAVAPASDKIEHGSYDLDEICRLAERLLKVDASAHPKAEPGILVQRGDKGWRIAVHQGRLRVYKSMSLFDDFWAVAAPADIVQLPPFRLHSTPAIPTSHSAAAPRRHQGLRAVVEIAGLFVVALVLVAVGLRFGLPQKRLGDVPSDVMLVSSAEERAQVFATVAGSYATGRSPGNSLVTITPEGQVLRGFIGKDGKPTEPNLKEQAQAGRRAGVPCVVTSFAVIAAIAPPDTVKVGNFQYKRATVN